MSQLRRDASAWYRSWLFAEPGFRHAAAVWGLFTACLRFGILKVEARGGAPVRL